MYIKLPMYLFLFFTWRFDFTILMHANLLLREGVCPENLGDRFARCHFRAHKSIDFQGPTFPMARVTDLARIKIITSRAI
jgi:hypothetical protein